MYCNLKNEIERKGLQEKEIAKLMSIPESELYSKISGKKSFTINEAFKMYEILGNELSVEYLFKQL